MRGRLPGLLLSLLPAAVSAQDLPAPVVGDCTELARADAIREPWAENTATYAEGAIRIAVLDLIEPAGAPMHLLVISPPQDEIGARQCRVVSAGPGGTGFFDLALSGRSASYDPAVGLALTLPIQVFDAATGGGLPARLRVVIDQASGRIIAEAAR